MRKWRPTHKCIYVIPEVRGNFDSLVVILQRIFPLRIFEGQEDIVVFLGNYIDGDEDGNKIISSLIDIKNEYDDRVIILRGAREQMLLQGAFGNDNDFNQWTDTGGMSTILGYLKNIGSSAAPTSIKRNRILDIIPNEHLSFLKNLPAYSIVDDYCFFSGGFDSKKTITENSINNFYFDTSSSAYVKNSLKNNKIPEFKDNYIFIGCNNYMGKIPFIYSKYMMLGGMAPDRLFTIELNSMEACAAKRGKTRIYKYEYKIYE